jgi:PAS domain S-box-containing protein
VRRAAGKILWGICFVLALGGLGLLVGVSHECGELLRKETLAVTHTRDILTSLSAISTSLGEVESSARSFAISGKQSHLDPFYTAAKQVPEQLEELKKLLRDDPEALGALTKTEPLINRHIKAMKDMVDLGKKGLFGGSGQRKQLTDAGNSLMEEIRSRFSAMEKAQRAELARGQEAVAAGADRVMLVGLVATLASAALVLVFGIWGLRAMSRRTRAEEKLDRLLGSMPDALVIVNTEGRILSSNGQTARLFGYSERELQGESMALLVPERERQSLRQYYLGFSQRNGGRVAEKALELCGLRKDGREFPIEIGTKPLLGEKGLLVTSAIRDVTERKKAGERIAELNRELKNRAAELETANRELEAFSYSVSHDLRSPLQNIDSFSQILIEEHANRLGADGRDCVQRLRGGCQHMEEIIEALLALSNMARHELVPERVELSALAKSVADELKQKDPDRLVDWMIAEGLTAEGDPRLMRVVLENLLGNAWKFTAKRPRARIEFGALPQSNGTRTYFVRDDGAGFDMARAGDLFAPFKRLHDQSQFRGTGIGLATVQRVIRRHHGRIWAEGVVDQGATFCFTLGDENNGRDHQFAETN